MKAGDAGAAARLAGVLAFPAYQHGRVATVERWFGWLDDHGAMEDHAAAVPHLAVQARIELARCHLALADFTAARTLLREADEILARRPRLGVFVQQAKDLRAERPPARDTSAPGASTLTAAEFRLLPMLSTHCRSRRSPRKCSFPATPSGRRCTRFTANWRHPHATRRLPGRAS
jgi:hypothetical protein